VTFDIYSHVTLGLQEAAAARFDEAFSKYNNDAKDKSVKSIH
jgi:hypothetical protein